jgi:hypothetical protein
MVHILTYSSSLPILPVPNEASSSLSQMKRFS